MTRIKCIMYIKREVKRLKKNVFIGMIDTLSVGIMQYKRP